MAEPNKLVIPDKVQKDDNKKFKIKKDKSTETEVGIEILEDGDYEVEKLSIEGLPTIMEDGTSIRWFNNFAIQKNGKYINQKYKITIPGLSNMEKSRLVIFNGNGNLYYYTGIIVDDTFELSEGDPAVGGAP